MSSVQLRLEVEHLRDGQLLERKSCPVNSFVRQSHEALANLFRKNTPTPTARDTDGVVRTLFAGGNQFYLHAQAGAGVTARGIQLGTSEVPPDRDDFVIGALIAHGTGPGQLGYNAVVINEVDGIAGGFAVSVERQFDNNSGGIIAATEVTLVVQITTTATPADLHFLALHDSITETIANGASFIARYIWEFLV